MTTHTDASRAAAITRAMALAIHAKATELANRGIPVCVDPEGAGDLTIASLLADAAFRAASEVRT